LLESGVAKTTFCPAVWAAISSGRTWRGQLVNERKNGTHYTEEASISPVRDAGGVITSYVAVKRDITQELDLQGQLLHAQKMEGIGRLAGGVAHDFNNLLSVILSYTEFAVDVLPDGDPLKDDLLEVKKAGEYAVLLTRQLLAFSRKQILQPVPLDMNQFLVEMEKLLRRIIGEDIDIARNLAPDLGLVKADLSQLEQVMMNLAVNARDAMPQGGKLIIETANAELDEEHAARHAGVAPGPYVMLAVTDSGVGMDEQTMARLFEPFFTTKALGRGTGLGLSTVYGIVTQSGGSILVHSEVGRGTTFKIYLPRELSGKATATKSRRLDRVTGTETVLVVEDEDALRTVTRRILETAGYTVLTAANGDEALGVSARYAGHIHLLLSDVVMPGMNGGALARELEKTRQNLKVLYMSGYTDNSIVHHGVLNAGTHFLGKPFSTATLTQKLREVLDDEVVDPPGQHAQVL
jgi:signal transduction histidine kinase/ActR/RegA family two-component response regulator